MLLRSCNNVVENLNSISTHTYQCEFFSFQFPSRHLQLLPRYGGCMFLVIDCHTSQSQKNLNTNNCVHTVYFGTHTVCGLHTGVHLLYTYEHPAYILV